jgi:hypothetical protein
MKPFFTLPLVGVFVSLLACNTDAAEMSLSKLAPAPKAEDEISLEVKAEGVTIDKVPYLQLTSREGTIYLSNEKREELSAKRLEQAQCASMVTGKVVHSAEIGHLDVTLNEDIKPHAGMIVNAIHSKCAVGSNGAQAAAAGANPELEASAKYQSKKKHPRN